MEEVEKYVKLWKLLSSLYTWGMKTKVIVQPLWRAGCAFVGIADGSSLELHICKEECVSVGLSWGILVCVKRSLSVKLIRVCLD